MGPTRRGSLSRKDRRVPGAAAIGDEENFIVGALRRAARRVAARADDPHCREGAGWPCLAARTRRAGRSRITLIALIALRPLSAAREAEAQGNRDQCSIEIHGVAPIGWRFRRLSIEAKLVPGKARTTVKATSTPPSPTTEQVSPLRAAHPRWIVQNP
jgi:hypothetical protein